MFKKILIILACLLLLNALYVLTYAEPQLLNVVERTQEVREMLQSFDSRHVDDEILGKLNASETDRVIKIFEFPPESFFAQSRFEQTFGSLGGQEFNIETLFAEREFLGTTYLILDNNNNIVGHYWIDNTDILREVTITYGDIQGLLFAFLDEDFIKAISPDIIVENVFLFDGDMRLNSGIYYVTNMGDFMHFGGAILPIYDFKVFAEAAWLVNFATNWGAGDDPDDPAHGGGLVVGDLDMSQYRVGSPNFNPFGGVPEEILNIISLDGYLENDESSRSDTAFSILGVSLPVFWSGVVALVVLLGVVVFWCFIKRKQN